MTLAGIRRILTLEAEVADLQRQLAEAKQRAKRAALAANPGAEIIDMGVGEPDEMAFAEVVAELHKEASKPDNRGYADNGDNALKQSAARYMERVSGVSVCQ